MNQRSAKPSLPVALGERIDTTPVIDYLRPIIQQYEQRIEDDARLPDELVDILHDAGVFSTLLPREYGGRELHPVDHFDFIFELSRINGSVGWCAMIQTGGYPMVEPEVFAELSGKKPWLTAGSHGRIGTEHRVEGGYRFTGEWRFCSGSAWAQYLTGWAKIVDDEGNPIIDLVTGEEAMIDGLFAKADVTVLDEWNPMGMRGTGSGGFTVEDEFLEERFTMGADDIPDAYRDRAVYNLSGWAGQLHIAAMMLGSVQGMVDEFVKVAALRRERFSFTNRAGRMGREQLHQIRIAEAHAEIRAVVEWARALGARDYDAALRGETLPYEDGVIAMQAVPLHAGRVAKEIALTLFGLAGADAVPRDSGLSRAFRDTLTGSQHTAFLEPQFQPIGQYLLSKDSPEGVHIDESFLMPLPPRGE
ncbi:acyl-CoA dehydrogenase family protein [Leifsonia kafniensis]|uniref:Acyl-CoA dehydrogenase family protein n=1 Tax=Leifsonia kafniensis TaxID=475957 RepID=A0ABP7KMG9_9MICO